MAEVKEQPPIETSLYERDFALWADEQARLLRTGRLDKLDLPNLIDEVEDLSGRQRSAIQNNLRVVLLHLLKWQFQPSKRSRSWRSSIREHRERIRVETRQSPSLRRHPAAVFLDAYASARLRAADEAGLSSGVFPEEPPFTIEQALDPDFMPE